MEKGGPLTARRRPQIFLGRSQPNFTWQFQPTLTLFNRLRLERRASAAETGFSRPDDNYSNQCQSGVCALERRAAEGQSRRAGALPARSLRRFHAAKRELRAAAGNLRELHLAVVAHSAHRGEQRVAHGRDPQHRAVDAAFRGLDPEASYVSEQFIETNYAITPPLETLVVKLNVIF